jgi:hypothetical protein
MKKNKIKEINIKKIKKELDYEFPGMIIDDSLLMYIKEKEEKIIKQRNFIENILPGILIMLEPIRFFV